MAHIKRLVTEVKDITECPICTDMLSHPKMLPCYHMFCLKCIERYCEEKDGDEAVPCPMCRKEFNIPIGGLSKLDTNFFIERLIAAQSTLETSWKEDVDCDVCLVGKRQKVTASSFCLECRENMCNPCSSIHKSMRMSMSHQIMPLLEASATETKTNKNFCDKHPQEEIKLYCHKCKITCCTICFVTKHSTHKCSEIEEIVDKLKKRFMKHSDDVSKLITGIKEQSAKVDDQMNSFIRRIDTAEKGVIKQSEAIKIEVDKHVEAFMEDLHSRKSKFQKSIHTTKEELDRDMMICENFVIYCRKVIEKADFVEVTRIAGELETRAKKLKAESITELIEIPDFNFIPSGLTFISNQKFAFGNLQDMQPVNKIGLKGKFGVVRVAWLENLIYVICMKSHTVRVFPDHGPHDEMKENQILLKEMKNPWDMTANETCRSIIISDRDSQCLWKIQFPSREIIRLEINGLPTRLFSTCLDGLLVMVKGLASCIHLDLYPPLMTTGKKTIPLSKQINDVFHAIQSSNGNFIISFSMEASPVCWIGVFSSDGKKILRKFDPRSVESIPLNRWFPYHLALDEHENILVADYSGQHRVFLLNSRLTKLQIILNGDQHGIEYPRRLCYCAEKQQLMVGQAGARACVSLFNLSSLKQTMTCVMNNDD